MQIIMAETRDVGRRVADLVAEASPRVLGVATGSSPLTSYAEMVSRRLLRSDIRLCLLDEYLGLPCGHPARYRSMIVRRLGELLERPDQQVHAPDVDRRDHALAALRYDAELRDLGGVELQILGIGRNGHIGFNEPGTPFASRTHVTDLSPTTRADNARFFDHPDQVPRRAITQGLATIAEARRIVLIATGSAKREAITRLVTQPPSIDLPASMLADHPDTIIVGDQAALAGVVPFLDEMELI